MDSRPKKKPRFYAKLEEDAHAFESDGEIDAELAQMFETQFVPGVAQPHRQEIEETIRMIDAIAQMGPPVLLAAVLRMVLRDRITDEEIQLICDTFYHD